MIWRQRSFSQPWSNKKILMRYTRQESMSSSNLPENSVIRNPQAAASVHLSALSCRAARLQVLTVSLWGLYLFLFLLFPSLGHDSPHHHKTGFWPFPLITVVFTHCQTPRLSFLEPGILFVKILPVPPLGTLSSSLWIKT